ncbi:enoyl-CoA hydratase/isomerase family protein [Desulfallas sp. Bu1-1]|uniref:enoyl-CoA hydratase/isomerase family protein n=1 Tax=Desulfallas sp. Bu1-1 TaxID=2787620 RepID=UPI00189C78D3|nr:enoyl-CoA hydratase-related protein [Desulfallas sp. Bu1-1]MBF7082859.1 enoyl-CoA hydratase/isomerase family protein [Desulfallas sp. Bu1-1]
MEFSEIIYDLKNGVATITLNRPESLNAISISMARELALAIEWAARDSECRTVVLTGAGRAFSVGGDIKYMKKGLSAVEGRNYVMEVGRPIMLIHKIEKPVIAVVNGYAMGAGFNLALAADLLVAVKGAKFGQVFTRVGLAIDGGGSYFLPKILGPARAKELVFTGRIIDAEEALQMGLVNKVVEKDKLEQVVSSLAGKLSRGPSQALGLAKMLINAGMNEDLETIISSEAFAQSVCMQTGDHKEGLAAFLEKREPVFGKK